MNDEEFEETFEERMEKRFLLTQGSQTGAHAVSGYERDHDWAKDAIECNENDADARRISGLPAEPYQEGEFI